MQGCGQEQSGWLQERRAEEQLHQHNVEVSGIYGRTKPSDLLITTSLHPLLLSQNMMHKILHHPE